MNYLKENKEPSISTLAQLEIMIMLGMGENNRHFRETREDFNISHISRCIYPLTSSEKEEKKPQVHITLKTTQWKKKTTDVWGEIREKIVAHQQNESVIHAFASPRAWEWRSGGSRGHRCFSSLRSSITNTRTHARSLQCIFSKVSAPSVDR